MPVTNVCSDRARGTTMGIDFNQRMMLGHKDVTWKVGLYFGQGIQKYKESHGGGTAVGLRTYDTKQRERVLLSCKLAKDVVLSAIDNVLTFGPSHRGPITPKMVLINLAMERKRMALHQGAKKLFDETRLAVPPDLPQDDLLDRGREQRAAL